MDSSFFRTTDLPSLTEMLKEFKSELIHNNSTDKSNKGFLDQFLINADVFKYLINVKQLEKLPLIFETLYRQKKIKEKIFTDELFYKERDSLFSLRFRNYLKHFRISARDSLKDFKSFIVTEEYLNSKNEAFFEPIYFRKFLIFSTFFCTAFNYNFLKTESGQIHVEESSNLNDTLKSDFKRYYLFYNRSHIDKMEVGIGEVTIREETDVRVKYFYLKSDEPKQRKTRQHQNIQKNKLITLRTRGKVAKYPGRSILVLKNLIDENLTDENSGDGVESFYVVKQINESQEKILLGINCSWNRDSDFPYATAALLIEQETYDQQYDLNSTYTFENVKKTRIIPPSIHYYLYDQSISLESVISNRYDSHINLMYPLIKFSDIPFYLEEGQYLKYLAGKYKGLTIVKSNDREELILSLLEINENGLVQLTVTNERNEIISFADNFDKGFVKNLFMDEKNDRGKIFINLRYHFSKHYNALNYYLSFENLLSKEKTSSPFYLKGSYAGESLVSNDLIGASIIFKKLEEDDVFEVSRKELNLITNADLLELYNKNQDLFNFYLSKNTELFTNESGIDLLRKKVEIAESEKIKISLTDKYEIYISIPLTIFKDEHEYLKNRDIADKFISEITARFAIDRSKIFCACMYKGNFFSYEEYCNHFKVGAKIYNFMQLLVQKTKLHVHLRPKNPRTANTYKMSSSIVEVAYASAYGNKVIIICDEEEKENLPDNLLKLNEANIYTFSSENSNAFKELFDSYVDGLTLTEVFMNR